MYSTRHSSPNCWCFLINLGMHLPMTQVLYFHPTNCTLPWVLCESCSQRILSMSYWNAGGAPNTPNRRWQIGVTQTEWTTFFFSWDIGVKSTRWRDQITFFLCFGNQYGRLSTTTPGWVSVWFSMKLVWLDRGEIRKFLLQAFLSGMVRCGLHRGPRWIALFGLTSGPSC